MALEANPGGNEAIVVYQRAAYRFTVSLDEDDKRVYKLHPTVTVNTDPKPDAQDKDLPDDSEAT